MAGPSSSSPLFPLKYIIYITYWLSAKTQSASLKGTGPEILPGARQGQFWCCKALAGGSRTPLLCTVSPSLPAPALAPNVWCWLATPLLSGLSYFLASQRWEMIDQLRLMGEPPSQVKLITSVYLSFSMCAMLYVVWMCSPNSCTGNLIPLAQCWEVEPKRSLGYEDFSMNSCCYCRSLFTMTAMCSI